MPHEYYIWEHRRSLRCVDILRKFIRYQFICYQNEHVFLIFGSIKRHTWYEDRLVSYNEIKVLGVTLDDRLNFKSHVDDICNRASRQINSFKGFSKYLKIDRRLFVYKCFIRSNFSYCPVAWLFCGRNNSNKLGNLHEPALRIVFNDFSSSYEFLCERANTLPLSFYRLGFLGIDMYKCIKETNPTYLKFILCTN